MWCPDSSWGSWHCPGLSDNWEQAARRSIEEVGETGPCVLPLSFCKGTCVAAALHFLVLFLFKYASTCERSGQGVLAML